MIDVKRLWISPIKSAQLNPMHALIISSNGFKYDRMFGVAHDGVVLTQREFGRLAQIRTFALSSEWTTVSWDGDDLTLPNYGVSGTAQYQIWKEGVQLDVIQSAEAWINRHMGGTGYQIVRFGNKASRKDKRSHAGSNVQVKLTDGSQVLLINSASLYTLNGYLMNAVRPEAFRANIMVEGAEPWAEDSWKTLKIVGKEVYLLRVGHCMRCEITTLDPSTGEKLSKEPLATLGRIRRRSDAYLDGKLRTGAAFGAYFYIVAKAGEVITLEDKLEIVDNIA